jgi:predicted ATP-grasp superfamily ATP-dependent carboligase
MKISDNQIGIIIIGGHVQGLGIARIYGEMGLPSIVLDDNRYNIARHSKYVKKYIFYQKYNLLSKLIHLGKSGKYANWLVMPTNDYHIMVISKNKADLEQYFKVSSDKWEIIDKFYNKRITYRLTEKIGIDYPRTWMPDTEEDLKKIDCIYPCIIKPAVMHNMYSVIKKKVLVCNDFNELVENYRKVLTIIPPEEVLVQDIIPGSNENQYSACFTFYNGEPYVSLVARRKRQHPLDFGNATTFAETLENDELVESAKKLLKEADYSGVCEVEFKQDDRDGKFKFLEVNPRTWKWHVIAKKSKSPFLKSMFHKLYNLEPVIKNDWSQAYFKHVLTDVWIQYQLIKKGKYKYKNYHNVQYAVWEKNDILPPIMELVYFPITFIKRTG